VGDEVGYEIWFGVFDLSILSVLLSYRILRSRRTAIRAFIWFTLQSVHSFIGPAKDMATPSVFINQGICWSRPNAARLPVIVFRILSATSLCSPLMKPNGFPNARSAIISYEYCVIVSSSGMGLPSWFRKRVSNCPVNSSTLGA
jgi:hypothetical protein